MTGSAFLLSLVLLAIALIDHRVWTTSIPSDTVKLSARNSHTNRVEVRGKSYPKDGVLYLPKDGCCLVFDKNQKKCNNVSVQLSNNCACSVVYQYPGCGIDSVKQYTIAVQRANGSSVVFTTQSLDDRDRAANDIYDLQRMDLLTIPVIILLDDEISNTFYGQLSNEPGVMVYVEVNNQDGPSNEFNNTRSATTFYFVVFAFTILLLLSLTWFVFNYLRRCHHMYTVKRQRVRSLIN